MTLMSNRCTSARGEQEELFSDREPPFGIHIPQYFYVQQHKPSPMSPLKVWRGYKGNVYFEPINVRRINSAHAGTYSSQLDRVASEQTRQSVASSAGTQFGNSISRGISTPLTRATTAVSGQASRNYRYIEPVPSSAPQVFVMDKQAVVDAIRNSGTSGGQSREDVQRDLHFIEGLESTGSLAVRPLSGSLLVGGASNLGTFSKSGRHRDRKLLHKRDRLCKGPNFSALERRGKEAAGNNNTAGASASQRKTSSHSTVLTSPRSSSRVSVYRPGSRSAGPGLRPHRASVTCPQNEPNLVVSGDKFAPPTVMSPLLRTTGQFSLGAAESACGAQTLPPSMSELPTHLQVQGRRAAHTSTGPGKGRRGTTRPLTCSEELKPFIKYSHDVKVNYERNNVNYC
ncbi:hypothetical protein EGW08_017274 [Elysia chlorotica]|uniref:Uncharacterized protein n=1 Tax=Elysia chlorotica TaxID=188477 RepID=A0A433T090_ELYCH|nr:hypothetical protein EGW08_017274 [Elysia chlorotica]